jgi:hypothetical protein
MKIRTYIWTILIIASVLVIQALTITKIYRDNRRLTDNFAALAKGTEYYRINDSISAARSERILLDNAEIKAYFPEITKAVEQMDVKLRQLERYSAISSSANYEIATKIYQDLKDLQDTQDLQEFPVVIHQSPPSLTSQPSPIQYTSYKDKWLDFQQAIVADSAYTAIQTRDSISIVQSWERSRKFLFLHWGRKRHIQTVTNANPHATIKYSIYVEKSR